jgi:hypothetical protein
MKNVNIIVQLYIEGLCNIKEEFPPRSSQYLKTCEKQQSGGNFPILLCQNRFPNSLLKTLLIEKNFSQMPALPETLTSPCMVTKYYKLVRS